VRIVTSWVEGLYASLGIPVKSSTIWSVIKLFDRKFLYIVTLWLEYSVDIADWAAICFQRKLKGAYRNKTIYKEVGAERVCKKLETVPHESEKL